MAIKSDPAQAKLDIQTPEVSREELIAELLETLSAEKSTTDKIKCEKYILQKLKTDLDGLVTKREDLAVKINSGQVIFNVSADASADETDDDLNDAYPSDDELAECDTSKPDKSEEGATKLLPGEIVDEDPFGIAADEIDEEDAA